MQKIFVHIAISAAIITGVSVASFFGTRAWVDYEKNKAEDAWRMSQVVQIHTGLLAYYKDHAAYPSSGTGAIVLGGLDSACLSADGFVSPVSYECKKMAYLPRVEAGLGKDAKDIFTYRAFEKDNTSPCETRTPCPAYAIQFFLSTGSILPTGVHTLTLKGLK